MMRCVAAVAARADEKLGRVEIVAHRAEAGRLQHDQVLARSEVGNIIAVLGLDRRVEAEAVVPFIADEPIPPLAAAEEVIAETAAQPVAALVATQHVVARTAIDLVVAAAALERVAKVVGVRSSCRAGRYCRRG